MALDLSTILIFCVGALIYAALLPANWRRWALLITSVIAVYWLQPTLNIRFLDFILPTLTLLLTLAVWMFTRQPDQQTTREDHAALGAILVLVLAMSLFRYIQPELRLTPSRPPQIHLVLLGLFAFGIVVLPAHRLTRTLPQRGVLTGLIIVIIGFFVVIKTEPLAVAISGSLRAVNNQDTALANINDLGWLGFSYVAFRLIHTIRDRQMGRLPALSLREFMTYVVFFPSLIAGPIDRAERFIKDYRAVPEIKGLEADRFTVGTTRIMIGLFKKFVIADTLALGMSLNATNAEQATSTLGLWLLLYGYALRLFFDFSGYSDIAIGIGILFGITLPENFDRPYLKNNIAAFWQSWHITLSNWARFYVFTPLSRLLLTRQPKPSPVLVVFSAQMATMLTIGLWHGVTWNFFIWGAWHGVGLFIHKRWSDRTRKWYRGLDDKPNQKRTWTFAGWFITFHFVVLSWVWFALPEFDQSMRVFAGLFGVNQ